jgi:hypothetical protein
MIAEVADLEAFGFKGCQKHRLGELRLHAAVQSSSGD